MDLHPRPLRSLAALLAAPLLLALAGCGESEAPQPTPTVNVPATIRAAVGATLEHTEPTRTPPSPTETPGPTATPSPTPLPVAHRADAQYLDPRRLATDPSGHMAANIWLQGSPERVELDHEHDGTSYTWVDFAALVQGRALTEQVVVRFYPPNPDILRGECYRVYGQVIGHEDLVTQPIGYVLEVATVRAYDWEPAPRTADDSGCAPL